MRPNTRSPVTTVLLVLAATTAGLALMSVTAPDANAKTYVGQTTGGGRVAFKIDGGRMRKVEARIPASCESNNGQRWSTTLVVNVSGNLVLRSGRFRIQGRAPNGVRGDMRGRLRRGQIAGRVRLTFLDLDYVGPSDDSYVCDTGTRRFRAS
jgi:hypothetical protein